MVFWIFFFICLFFGLRELSSDGIPGLQIGRELVEVTRVKNRIHAFEETLASGCLPEEEEWEELAALPRPWGKILSESLHELRQQGASLLPTLRRYRELAASHEKSMREAKARSAQALAQSLLCIALIPILGSLLYLLVPGVEEKRLFWWSACAFALVWGGAAAAWLLRLSEQARWGGLFRIEQPWVLESLSFSERLIALLRAGQAPDVAWLRAAQDVEVGLLAHWGADVWRNEEEDSKSSLSLRESILTLGSRMRRAIQVSLLEGKPCESRLIGVVESFRIEMQSFQERELSLLPARAMKPLFFCIAPAVLGLLAIAITLGFQSQSDGIF